MFPQNFIDTLPERCWHFVQCAIASYTPYMSIDNLPYETEKCLSRLYRYLQPVIEIMVLKTSRNIGRNTGYVSQFFHVWEDDPNFPRCFILEEETNEPVENPVPGTRMVRLFVNPEYRQSFLARCKGRLVDIQRLDGDFVAVGNPEFIHKIEKKFEKVTDAGKFNSNFIKFF